THFSAVSPEELLEVERLTNESILAGYPVQTEIMSLEDAKKTGATAQFGEKYGSTVRVVNMGGYSLELCGGTHLDNTAKAGAFHITSEGSVASGVRRIEATTGQRTLEDMMKMQRQFLTAAELLKVRPEDLSEKLKQQINELKEDRKAIERFKVKERLGKADNLLISAKQVQGLRIVTSSLADVDVSGLRSMGDFLRDKSPNIVAVLACAHEGKITLLAVCGKEAIAKGVRAGDIIKAIAPICGGSGGGKPDSAMGGGKDLLKLDDALAAVDDVVTQKLQA
ncbi:MAG: alanine--tRNA ligase, partial [Clostridiales bacterium]|nr:alanine--tRNA ligase [Clostridiales bacterium]